MKSSLACLLLAVVILAGAMTLCIAQTGGAVNMANNAGVTDEYVVQKGDTLYVLEGNFSGKPQQWRRLLELNPFLKKPGRIRVDEKGRTIVIVRPGETLRGLSELGIIPQSFPLEQLKIKAEAVPVQAPVPEHGNSAWGWLLVVVLFLAGVALLAYLKGRKQEANRRREEADRVVAQRAVAEVREQELNQDPVTSGTPFVPGGIAAAEPDRIAAYFNGQAVQRYADRHPGTVPSTVGPVRIGPIEEGMISGEGMVGYLDHARPRRIDPPLPGYQARFRFPDGTEEILQSLMGCMNPVYQGEGMRGFTFTPGRVVVPAPVAPAPAQAAVAVPEPPPAPEPAEAPVVQAPVAEGEQHFTFKPAGGGKPNFVQFQGFNSFEVEVKDGKTQVRFS